LGLPDVIAAGSAARDPGLWKNAGNGDVRRWCAENDIPIVRRPTVKSKFYYLAPRDDDQAFAIRMRWH
jgi:hypothetical protein